MGQEISIVDFQSEHFADFRRHLAAEMELLRRWFNEEKFASDDLQCGLELEGWLIGQNGLPVPDNGLFLATLDRKSVVPELSKFNFELNVSPQYISGNGLRDMQSELNATWLRCEEVASRLEHRIVSVGILPTVEDSMLCIENMSKLQRYAALNAQVLQLRNNKPLQLSIQGLDSLQSSHEDLMLESAATSVQVHLKVPGADSVRYYNASVIASALTVALAANAPLLFGKRLWDDTRITVFEQAVDTAGQRPRVSFGNKYIESSLLELFEDNLEFHRVLLPVEMEEPPSKLPYVRMHNGTVWNWNRPLIGFERDGQPHLRIEHRPMSASPSIADLFADIMFYLGIANHLAELTPAPETLLPFSQAKKNFYASAQFGLKAQIVWLDGREYCVSDLVKDTLLPQALDGLVRMGVNSDSIASCGQILAGRLETQQNGAGWQRRKLAEYDGDLQRVLLAYVNCQATSQPVHLWD